jgi:signal peptidase
MSDPEAGEGDGGDDDGFVFGEDATGHHDGAEPPAPGGEPEDAGARPPGEGPRDPARARGNGAGEPTPETPREWVSWFLHTDHGAVVYFREVVSSIGVVVLVGLVLFAVSGLWPPMVAVESSSMYPHMKTGDLVFVMEEGRFPGDGAYAETGVVTYRAGQRTGYEKFQLPGDVIVYEPDGRTGVTPIIHRAHFWVNESENWYDKGDPRAMGGADSCAQLEQCPAPNAGFVTKGDNNDRYDQVSGLSDPVKPAWVVGTAEFRVPWLGNIRLWAGDTATPGAVGAAERATPGAVPDANRRGPTRADTDRSASSPLAAGDVSRTPA